MDAEYEFSVVPPLRNIVGYMTASSSPHHSSNSIDGERVFTAGRRRAGQLGLPTRTCRNGQAIDARLKNRRREGRAAHRRDHFYPAQPRRFGRAAAAARTQPRLAGHETASPDIDSP
jgi:hypothetical protein